MRLIEDGDSGRDLRRAVRDLQLRVGASDEIEVWTDLEVNLTSARVPATGGPDWVKLTDNGAGSTGVYGWGFSPTAVENLYFGKQVLHDWKVGTDLEPHIHYAPLDGNAGNVVWELEYTVAPIGQPFPASTVLTVTADAHRLAVNGAAADNHCLVGWDPDIVIPTDALKTGVSAVIMGRIARLGDDAADTYANDVIGLSVDFHYQVDGNGSELATLKYSDFPRRQDV